MEGLSVVGASPCVSSSVLSSSLSSPTSRLSCAPSCKLIHNPIKKHHHLAAFQPAFHLFASNRDQSRSHASKRNHTARIFLPHLVASMEQVEETYIMIKPDGVQRGLVGEIISRFEKKGFKLSGLKLFHCPKELAEVGLIGDKMKHESIGK